MFYEVSDLVDIENEFVIFTSRLPIYLASRILMIHLQENNVWLSTSKRVCVNEMIDILFFNYKRKHDVNSK